MAGGACRSGTVYLSEEKLLTLLKITPDLFVGHSLTDFAAASFMTGTPFILMGRDHMRGHERGLRVCTLCLV